MNILVLKEQDMKRAFDMNKAIRADKDALASYSKGSCNIPLRTNLNVPEFGGQSLYMQGYVPDVKGLGVKIVSVYPGNIEKGLTSVPATMVLLNAETGEVAALLDGTYLTRLRTGAVAGAATDLLARQDAKIFALFGTGGQAETQLEAVLCARKLREVRVFDLSAERAQHFAEAMQAQFGVRYDVTIRAVASADEAVEDADIITSVTTSRGATFDGSKVKAGAHVNGVGSYTPQMAEIDGAYVSGADLIFCDTKDAIVECGSLTQALDQGLLRREEIRGELGELINGTKIGRRSEQERTLFITTGNAVLDIVTARRIYEEAVRLGIGSTIEL